MHPLTCIEPAGGASVSVAALVSVGQPWLGGPGSGPVAAPVCELIHVLN